jgi:hypothetical protein
MTGTVKYKPVECAFYTGSVYHLVNTVNKGVLQGSKRRRKCSIESKEAVSCLPEPEEILMASVDKECPRCGLTQAEGFDVGIENDAVFGVRCGHEHGGCGFSF